MRKIKFRKKPLWSSNVTSDLVTDKSNLEHEYFEVEEQKKRQHYIDRTQEQIEEDEFQNLVAEIARFKFKKSSDVSRYIISNNLGYKYKNISGILKMELDDTIWNFKGGFPPKIYARLCDELKLSNSNTKARVLNFESFNDIEERSHKR